jgi:hypothetical protein
MMIAAAIFSQRHLRFGFGAVDGIGGGTEIRSVV